jgi:hypothetical protein
VASFRSSNGSGSRSTGAAQLGQKRASAGNGAPHWAQAVTTSIVAPIAETLKLRAEQTKAVLNLIAAHLSRVHSVSHRPQKKNPAISSAFPMTHSGGRI